jgi:hypothetical protein
MEYQQRPTPSAKIALLVIHRAHFRLAGFRFMAFSCFTVLSARAFRSHCQHHRKHESQRDVIG